VEDVEWDNEGVGIEDREALGVEYDDGDATVVE
jgi:hypothetical protein